MRKIASLFTVLMLSGTLAFGQARNVTGVVRDDKGDPVPYANVTEAGTRNAVQADAQGNFSINISASGRLAVSATGYTAQTITVSGTTATVSLVRSQGQLQEVVVTAQGIRREKRGIGYSAPTVSNAELTRGQSTSALNALQGKVAGVNITSTAGAPGSSSRVVLRGGSSITGSNQALFVVDGIPIDNSSITGGVNTLSSVDFGNRGNDINPEDIESITVLKGPGATALYGSRASNGALIITTKSGKGNQNKKNEVTFSIGITFSSILKLPELQNEYGQGYDNTTIDPKENWSWGPRFDGVVRPWGQAINGVRQERPYSAVKNNVRDFFETGTALNNNISFSGAGNKSTYFLSLNALNSNGIMPTDRDEYNKYSVRFNGTTQLANRVSSSVSVTYSRINSDLVSGGQGTGSIYNNVLQTPRNIPLTELKDLSNPYNSMGGIYDASGNELFGFYGAYNYNPYYLLAEFRNKNNVDRVIGNFSISYKPVQWLDITNRLGGDIYTDRRLQVSYLFPSKQLMYTGGMF